MIKHFVHSLHTITNLGLTNEYTIMFQICFITFADQWIY